MSQWHYKTDDGTCGPVSFKELAVLVREGKVSEGTQVCRAGTADWQPAWHVPGLFRAAGIAVEGDSPPVEETEGRREGETERQSEATRATYQATEVLDLRSVALPLLLSIVVGVLAVGFFYRWAWQTTIAFPMPPVEVEGELIDCYFPLVGRCTTLECGLLYLDVFAVAALATWYAARKNRAER
jgi:hypothetical protein